MPRENSKCRDWEKERRNRLNDAFSILGKLLPNYDPAINASKIEVLRTAATLIEDLQSKIKELMSAPVESTAKKDKEELKKLQERVRRLLGKNEQLCTLLRSAKISIPHGCSVIRKFRGHHRFSQKITPEHAKVLQKQELQKGNTAKKGSKFENKPKGKPPTPRHRKAILNRSDKSVKISKKKVMPKSVLQGKCVIMLSQPSMSQSCYVITNAPSSNIPVNTSTVITNSGLLVSSVTKKTVTTIPRLGPGTLILANGTIMPVLPTQTVLPIANSLNPTPSNPTVILVSQKPTTSTTTKTIHNPSNKILPRLKPRYCLTRTTQVNKVPIPALTSRYANNDLVLNKTKVTKSSAKIEKKIVIKEVVIQKVAESAAPVTEPITEKPEETKLPEVVEKEVEAVKEPEIIEEIIEKPIEPEAKTAEAIVEETKETRSEDVDLNINHSELSNDIFASLQVPTGCQNPESTSPTAAFLLAFPLVSSLTGVKVTEVTEEDNTESQRETPTLLQIGTMETTKPTQSESLTPSLLNLDNLSFFSSKDISGFYHSFDSATTSATTSVVSTAPSIVTPTKVTKVDYQHKTNDLLPFFENSNRDLVVDQPVVNYQEKVRESVAKTASYTNYVHCSGSVTKVCSVNSTRSAYSQPIYTNSNTTTYSYPTDTNFNPNYYKNIAKTADNSRSYYSLNYENYSDYRRSDNGTNYYSYPKEKYNNSLVVNNSSNNNNNNNKSKSTEGRLSINNWMTTPDNRIQAPPPASDFLPQFTKENDFTHNTFYPPTTNQSYFNSNSMYTNANNENQSKLDLPLVPPPINTYQRNEPTEENQFSWSPSKIPQFLDASHTFVSSTLPTLVGDLALGNPLTFNDQKPRKEVVARGRGKAYEPTNQSNFLSVSQLVDAKEVVPARANTRRNSGNRGAKKSPQKGGKSRGEVFCDTKVSRLNKNASSSYSAEALIGHQMQDMGQKNRTGVYNNKGLGVPPFLPPDNIIPYFPPVDLPQESYMQTNQNYQSSSFGHNFTSSFQNNSYNPTTSSYLGSNNFMHHDVGGTNSTTAPAEYDLFTKEKPCSKPAINRPANLCPPAAKKTKRKHPNEIPNFADFSSFLTMPSSINSPILPDDFHTHTGFLQPPTPQLYPCKNPLYSSKQNEISSSSLLSLPVPGGRTNVQHAPEISSAVNNVGTSLTNFNLSTIFPEINTKGTLGDNYLEPRMKEHSSRNSTVQVPFNEKPSFSFSYINAQTSQTYNQ